MTLTARGGDRYKNASTRGVVWSSLTPRLIKVTRLSGGRVEITGVRAGVARLRVHAGKAGLTITVGVV